MKKKYWLYDLLVNIGAFALIIGEFLLCYYTVQMTTLFLTLIAVFIMLFANVYFSYKEGQKFVIWRIVHCGLIIYIGWLLASFNIDSYHLATAGTLDTDPMSQILANYFFGAFGVFAFVALLLWQLVIVGVLIYHKRTEKVHKE